MIEPVLLQLLVLLPEAVTKTANANSTCMFDMVTELEAASVTITASSVNICQGTSVTFTAVPVNGGTTPAYQWKVDGANVGTDSPTYVTTSLTNGQVVTCVMTSNGRIPPNEAPL